MKAQTKTSTYNPQNVIMQKIEEMPYDPEYVEQVLAMDKSTFKKVNIEELWI